MHVMSTNLESKVHVESYLNNKDMIKNELNIALGKETRNQDITDIIDEYLIPKQEILNAADQYLILADQYRILSYQQFNFSEITWPHVEQLARRYFEYRRKKQVCNCEDCKPSPGDCTGNISGPSRVNSAIVAGGAGVMFLVGGVEIMPKLAGKTHQEAMHGKVAMVLKGKSAATSGAIKATTVTATSKAATASVALKSGATAATTTSKAMIAAKTTTVATASKATAATIATFAAKAFAALLATAGGPVILGGAALLGAVYIGSTLTGSDKGTN